MRALTLSLTLTLTLARRLGVVGERAQQLDPRRKGWLAVGAQRTIARGRVCPQLCDAAHALRLRRLEARPSEQPPAQLLSKVMRPCGVHAAAEHDRDAACLALGLGLGLAAWDEGKGLAEGQSTVRPEPYLCLKQERVVQEMRHVLAQLAGREARQQCDDRLVPN